MSVTPIPVVANTYLKVVYALPEIKIPFTNLDISVSLLSAVFLTTVRLANESFLVRFFNWPENATPTKEAAASMASICHSTILCVGLIAAFLSQKYDVAALIKDQASKKWWPDFADALLQFCTGYMIYDTCVNILWLRWNPELMTVEPTADDYLYLAHHMMCTFYMTSARVIGAGYMSAMICMLTGEITNPLMNMYLMGEEAMKLGCCNGPTAQLIHYWVTIAFAAAYFFVRVVVGPAYFANLTYVLLFTKRGRENVPLPLNIFWNVLVWGVAFGSVSWIQKCYGILAEFAVGKTGTEAQEL